MDKRRIFIISALLSALPLCAHAQNLRHNESPAIPLETGRWLTDNEHYYASQRSLDDRSRLSVHADVMEADALALIDEYRLCGTDNAESVAESIRMWLEGNEVSVEADRLRLMMANLLVRAGRNHEALAVYSATEAKNVGDEELAEAYFYEALANVRTGNLSMARSLLLSISNNNSREVDVIFLTSYIDYCEGNYSDALAGFKTVAETREYGGSAFLYIADINLKLKRPNEALQALKSYSEDAQGTLSDDYAQRIEGEALYDLGRYDDAIGKLEGLDYSNVEKTNRTPLYKLGMSYYQLKAYGKAAETLSRSAGASRDVMAQNAWLHAGISYLNSMNRNKASMAFQMASGMDADRGVQEQALYDYALTLHSGSETGFGESVSVFERFLNSFPNSVYIGNVTKYLTEVYFTTKNYPAALASINKIQNPSGEILKAKQIVLFNLGVQKFTNGDYNGAQEYMKQSVHLGKQDAQAYKDSYLWKGDAELRNGLYGDAVLDLRTYLSLAKNKDRNLCNASYSLGYAYFKQKDYAHALPYFRQCVSVGSQLASPASIPSSVLADANNRIGDCLFSERKYDEAITAYQDAINTDKSMGDYSLLQQGFIYGLKGDYKTKADLLAQMGSQYGNSQYSSDALYEQGRAYVQSGEKQQAISTYNDLITRFPQSANARKAGNEIGLVLFDMGKTEDAIAAYENVIEKYPNTSEAHTALANLKDIFTGLGRIDEYAALAQKAGQKLTASEIDEMLASAAEKAMSVPNYTQAYNYYSQLANQTEDESVRLRAQEGMLRSAHLAKDNNTTISAASAIIGNDKMSQDVIAEARIYRAESYMAVGDSKQAVADWQVLAGNPAMEYGARGTVELATYAYDTEQYASAEEILLKFIDSGTPHAYWLARGFVLLSDVYVKMDRKVEARQYLLSLKSNYSSNEEINKMVAERLNNL